jgi:uncharacterized protein (DUF1330 family)
MAVAHNRKGDAVTAYVIVDMEVTDPVGILDYRKLAEASVAQYGGRFIVRGGATEILDGEWQPKRVVVLEFPSAPEARRWHSSPEYAAACRIRNRAANTNMILVEGHA